VVKVVNDDTCKRNVFGFHFGFCRHTTLYFLVYFVKYGLLKGCVVKSTDCNELCISCHIFTMPHSFRNVMK